MEAVVRVEDGQDLALSQLDAAVDGGMRALVFLADEAVGTPALGEDLLGQKRGGII
jgi:hypothetical protein